MKILMNKDTPQEILYCKKTTIFLDSIILKSGLKLFVISVKYCYLSGNERVLQMLEPGNMFWKMSETGRKQWFRGLIK